MPSQRVAICMGSDSDFAVMHGAGRALEALEVPVDYRVLSAHRTPHDMLAFAESARANGFGVLIAGAGGAAHLPGMLASATTLPVIGVPVALGHLDGLDSLLSIVQMPRGVPVATVAVDNATNAGLLAARILAVADDALAGRLEAYRQRLAEESRAKTLPLEDRPPSTG